MGNTTETAVGGCAGVFGGLVTFVLFLFLCGVAVVCGGGALIGTLGRDANPDTYGPTGENVPARVEAREATEK